MSKSVNNQILIKGFVLFLLIFGCKKSGNTEFFTENIIKTETVFKTKNNFIDSTKLGINLKPSGNYSRIKNSIINDRAYFKSLYERNVIKATDSASSYLYSKLINDIVPHWYGTPWDFNGHTNMPNQGEIACGYFVSTTLKHLGFNLNRYKMAQQAGLVEAKMLQTKAELKIYSNLSFSTLKAKLNSVYKNGIYFVGLDNHVGYVLIKDEALYFLHSSYCDDKVVIELAETSPCFSSNFYVFAEITTNKKLVKRWIFNEKLTVPSN
ncbi:hypothetical protein Q4Q35_20620 [Flavivirga aquimarina]|uniref:Peptidase C39-like domain-containing protein n=1 Tax=Flavivirga aquimarina TaxID=2027862 RepID=A0ABT8WGC7_9FLAO|nr:hypothetical protein [Flavivirga aquimarina]MDO5972209.1 hypothetical protein [Flavivirga aquimarina]